MSNDAIKQYQTGIAKKAKITHQSKKRKLSNISAYLSTLFATFLMVLTFPIITQATLINDKNGHATTEYNAPEVFIDESTLPYNWRLGEYGGIAVDKNDHVWVFHRPRNTRGLPDEQVRGTQAFVWQCENGVFDGEGNMVDATTDPADVTIPLTHTPPAECTEYENPAQLVDAFGKPRTLEPCDKNIDDCGVPAPSILKFNRKGKLLKAFGGPKWHDPRWKWLKSEGNRFAVKEFSCDTVEPLCEWPSNEHGIFVDQKLNLYIAGNGKNTGGLDNALNNNGYDGHVLKLSRHGKFILQVGKTFPSLDPVIFENNSTDGGINGTPQLALVADMYVDLGRDRRSGGDKFKHKHGHKYGHKDSDSSSDSHNNNELYIADGYGHQRIIVVDADTGLYKRHFGAYGAKPADSSGLAAPLSLFNRPIHAVRLTKDGQIYVGDTSHNRTQIFDKRIAGKVDCDPFDYSNDPVYGSVCGFINEVTLMPPTNEGILTPPSSGYATDIATSPDTRESLLFVLDMNIIQANIDGTGGRVFIYDRNTYSEPEVPLAILGSDVFKSPHVMDVDSKGNIYVGEVNAGDDYNLNPVAYKLTPVSAYEALELSIDDVTVTEGDTGTVDAVFTVTLSSASAQTVTVDYTTADGSAIAGNDYTATSGTLTFLPWTTTQTVTVLAIGDTLDEGIAETFSVNLSNASNATINDPSGIGTITDDDDNDTVSLAIDDVTVTEGDTGTVDAVFTVTLSSASALTVSVDFASADGSALAGSDYTSTTGTLTFLPGGPLTQTVTVSVIGDTFDEGIAETFSVNLSNASNATINDPNGNGTITDDDASPSLAIDDATVTEGDTGTVDAVFTVTLSSASGQTVTVDYTTADGSASAGSDYTSTAGTLTFLPGGPLTQTVTVSVIGDTLDEGIGETFSVNLSNPLNATINDVNGIGTITDDDASPSLAIDDVTVTEGDTGTVDAVFTVTLSSPSALTVSVDYTTADGSASAGSDYTSTAGTLTFLPGGPLTQTVTVSVIGDTLDEGIGETFSVNLSNALNATINDVNGIGTITDDDVAGFTLIESGGTTLVSENGSTDNFTVALDAQPLTDVILIVASADTGEATASPVSLTFTSANWDTPQTVTVTGVDDSIADGDQVSSITVSVNAATSDDNFDGLPDQTVSVTTSDDDVAGFTLIESGGTTLVSENGSTDNFTVSLDAQPLTDVVLIVASADTGEATASPVSLTFTSANWDTPQTVTVTGVDDSIADGDQVSSITVSVNAATSDDNFDGLPDQTVSVTTSDDDVAGFTLIESGGTTLVSENGSTDNFTVALDAQPLTDVILIVASADTGEATASPVSLTFTSANWKIPQTVTVTGVDDILLDGDKITSITISVDAPISDDNFDPLPDQTVSVTTSDDDVAGFTLIESGGTTLVSENGSTDNFTVALDAQPLTDVILIVASADTGEATASPVSLTFTSANWNIPQTVTVTGVDDILLDGDKITSITISVDAPISDDNFDPLPDQTVSVTTTDDDT